MRGGVRGGVSVDLALGGGVGKRELGALVMQVCRLATQGPISQMQLVMQLCTLELQVTKLMMPICRLLMKDCGCDIASCHRVGGIRP